MVLLGVGLIVIYAIGPMRANVVNAAYGTDISEHSFFIHQVACVAVSILALVLAFKMPYSLIRRFGKIVLIVGLVMCGLLALLSVAGSSLAKCELGACRWFNLGSLLSFQPAEILKLGLILYLAGLMAERKKEGKLESWSDFWLPFAIVCGLALGFVVVIQRDLGTGVTLMAIIVGMLFMSGVRLRYFAMTLGVILLAGVLAIVSSPHRMERLSTFSSEDSSDSYHIENAMIAIGSGGLLGVGPGNSVQATGYLPESINDSVFAVMGETFGFVGLLVIVACFTTLLLRLLKTANYLHDDEQELIVVGIFAWVTAHVVVNIAAMTGLLPLTGITLPLLSYGGTSMMFTAVALGLALQLSCYTSREPRSDKMRAATTSRRRGMNRSI